ncbi:hypothetical protein POJ06DRAFT_256289 [Lipomyces tetrasporus]|uniref:DNA polymerase kappa n=1 Tax=Lipomyces tetrasporus TaxID=54092 RepID=A0AAD7QPN0_9ASCO|nr:uncharacterized protein POJ06DRAFT_256289 [Lipomyces tetrasporus]KAJ8099193.1 hypothetical protein POJ06DRAFT_256289 [Lipomyces tetrasporus]
MVVSEPGPKRETTSSEPQISSKVSEPGTDNPGTLHRRLLGPSIQKSGQDGVDQATVSEIIYQATQGSKYFEHQKRKEKDLTKKVESIVQQAKKVSNQDLDAAEVRIEALIQQYEVTRDLTQIIVHVDCDAFYASVEELDHPELKSKPFAVGKGVLCTCNYEARKFGVRSAMAEFVAKKICPELVVLRLNFPKYIEKSNAIRKILSEYDPNHCAMTLDEAYLNITEYCAKVNKDREEVVSDMRRRILETTGVTVSAGIGPNSRVAKIASNINKPNGQFVIANDREAVMEFMCNLPVRKVTGVGYVLERQLLALNVNVCGDIYHKSALLYQLFTDTTITFLLNCYLGLGSTEVKPIDQYERKSVGCERTFRAISDAAQMKQKLQGIAEDLEKDCRRLNLAGRKLGLKLKKTTFEQISRQRPMPKPINTAADFYRYGLLMLEKELPITVRLIGLRLTDLVDLSHEGPMKTFLKGQRRQNYTLDDEPSTSINFHAVFPESFDGSTDIHDDKEMGELDMMIQGSQEEDSSVIDELRSSSKATAARDVKNAEELQDSTVDHSMQISERETLPLSTDSGETSSGVVACPICGNQVSADDQALNRHVDWCLSRGAIREAVKETFE